MTNNTKLDLWRRRKADSRRLPANSIDLRSPLQAQRDRSIAYQAALDVLG